MKLIKLFRLFTLSVFLLAMSTNMAFASSTEEMSISIDEVLLQKQQEIDQYVFEEHAAEIEAQGFIVTHTGPIGDVVEIGIQPYSEENANYLYELFGNELVKVVEGQQAVTLDLVTTSLETDDTEDTVEMEIVSATDDASEALQEKEDSKSSPFIISFVVIFILGCTALLIRKFKK